MTVRWYIWHEDTQTPENGQAYFGPFADDEIVERVNDAVADCLASFGDIEELQLSDVAAAKFYVNPREVWMKQLADMEE